MAQEKHPITGSKSIKQAEMMAKVAHDKDYAEKRGVPQHVAKEFHANDVRNKEHQQQYCEHCHGR